MTEQLDLPELERRWRESKSTIGREMFKLAEIRRDLRALEHERIQLRATPGGYPAVAMFNLNLRVEELARQRGVLAELHQCHLANHRFILQQLEETTGRIWATRARRRALST